MNITWTGMHLASYDQEQRTTMLRGAGEPQSSQRNSATITSEETKGKDKWREFFGRA